MHLFYSFSSIANAQKSAEDLLKKGGYIAGLQGNNTMSAEGPDMHFQQPVEK